MPTVVGGEKGVGAADNPRKHPAVERLCSRIPHVFRLPTQQARREDGAVGQYVRVTKRSWKRLKVLRSKMVHGS